MLEIIILIFNVKGVEQWLQEKFDGIIVIADKIPINSINEIAENDIPVVFVGNEGYSGVDNRTEIFIDMYAGAYELFNIQNLVSTVLHIFIVDT